MTSSPAASTRRHLGNFLALGIGNYGAMVVSMVINAMLTRRLGVDEFGRLALLLTTSQVIALLTANWSQSAVVRFGALEVNASGSTARTFWTRLWIVAPFALLPALAALIYGDVFASYLGVPLWGLSVVWIHFIAALAVSTVGTMFQARQEMKRYGVTLFLDKALMAAALLLAPRGWLASPLPVLGAYAGSSMLVAIGGLTVLGRQALLPITFHVPAIRAMWTFASPLMLSSWAGMLGTSWFDMLVIRWYRSPTELGWYSLGTLLAGVLQQVAIIMSTLLLPQLSVLVASGDLARVRTLVDRVLPYWLLGTSLLFSVAVVTGPLVVPFVFGRAFEPSLPVLAILMVASSALTVFSVFSTLASAFGATWTLTLITILSGTVNVVGNLFLIPPYGILGGALATVLAYFTSAVGVMLFVQRRWSLNVMPLFWLSAPVVVTSTLYLTTTGTVFFVLTPLLCAVAVYGLVRRFGLFTPADATFIRSLGPSALWGTR